MDDNPSSSSADASLCEGNSGFASADLTLSLGAGLGDLDIPLGFADQACKECRRRKSKCNKAIPTCNLCVKYRRHCLYEKHSRTPLTRKWGSLSLSPSLFFFSLFAPFSPLRYHGAKHARTDISLRSRRGWRGRRLWSARCAPSCPSTYSPRRAVPPPGVHLLNHGPPPPPVIPLLLILAGLSRHQARVRGPPTPPKPRPR